MSVSVSAQSTSINSLNEALTRSQSTGSSDQQSLQQLRDDTQRRLEQLSKEVKNGLLYSCSNIVY